MALISTPELLLLIRVRRLVGVCEPVVRMPSRGVGCMAA